MNAKNYALIVEVLHKNVNLKAFELNIAAKLNLSEDVIYAKVHVFHAAFKSYTAAIDTLKVYLTADKRNHEALYLICQLSLKIDLFNSSVIKDFSKIARLEWPLHREIKIFGK